MGFEVGLSSYQRRSVGVERASKKLKNQPSVPMYAAPRFTYFIHTAALVSTTPSSFLYYIGSVTSVSVDMTAGIDKPCM